MYSARRRLLEQEDLLEDHKAFDRANAQKLPPTRAIMDSRREENKKKLETENTKLVSAEDVLKPPAQSDECKRLRVALAELQDKHRRTVEDIRKDKLAQFLAGMFGGMGTHARLFDTIYTCHCYVCVCLCGFVSV